MIAVLKRVGVKVNYFAERMGRDAATLRLWRRRGCTPEDERDFRKELRKLASEILAVSEEEFDFTEYKHKPRGRRVSDETEQTLPNP